MSAPVDTVAADMAKDTVVRLRVTADERKRWQDAADRDQRTLSDWLRVVANAAAGPAPKRKRRA